MIKDMLKLSLPLALICAISAIALSKVNEMTAGPIAAAQLRAEREAVEAVLPPFAELRTDTLAVDGAQRVYYRGTDGGEVTGAAFRSLSGSGYSGEIEIMVGVDAAGSVSGVRILKHAETPGLGANYASAEVLDSFYKGRALEGVDWRVKKDGGDIDAVTGATVTGRALVEAVGNGMRTYFDDAAKLPEPAAAAAPENGAATEPAGSAAEPGEAVPAADAVESELKTTELPAAPVPESEEVAR